MSHPSGLGGSANGGAQDRIVSNMKKKLAASGVDGTEMSSHVGGADADGLQSPASGSHASASASVKFTSSHAKDAHEALKRSLQLAELSNAHGDAAVRSLGVQREVIQNSLTNVDETHEGLRGSRRVLREMKFAQWKEAGVKGLIILGLIGIIVVIVWVKWGKKR